MTWLNRLEISISENPPECEVAKVAKYPLAPLATAVAEPFQKEISPHDDAIREHLEERAAIMEYDGGLTRDQAEAEARRNMRVYEYRLTDNPDNWLVMIAPGTDLEEAQQSLHSRFGGRLLDVRSFQSRGGGYEKDRQSC